MFNSLRIRNFRAFDELKIDRLSRINLFTGRNNSGKTTLLEALFLLCGAGNPQMALNTNVVRGIGSSKVAAVPETFWKPIFTTLDMTKTVEIEGNHSSFGSLTLSIVLEQPDTIELPLDGSGGTSVEFLNKSVLLFSFKEGSKQEVNGRIQLAGSSFEVKLDQPASQLPFQAVILSSRIGNTQEDAIRLGQLRTRKQGKLVVDALQIVEPRLQSIEDNMASGEAMIWGDIKLPELVPLPLMGEGMTRVARLILAISAAPKGVILVDEIENGLHHSILNKVWKSVDAAARQFDTQIIASTHSFECMQAAQQSLEKDSFLVHRLENVDDKIRCITYEPDEISAAISHGLEVR